MYDQAHILLVNTHAKGVGGTDDRFCTADKGVLNALFQGRFQAGMKGFDFQSLGLQKLSQMFGVFPGCAIDDHTARRLKTLTQQTKDHLLLLVRGHRPDLVMEVGSFVATGEQINPLSQFTLDDIDNFPADITLGRCGKTLNRRDLCALPLRKLTDKANGIEIIRSKIMTPF